jgi:hypothetical protein
VLRFGKATNNDEIGFYSPVPLSCGMANLRIMMKLVFLTCSFVLRAGKSTNNDEIGVHSPVPVCCGLANLRIMMKLGFTHLFLCAGGWQIYE